MGSNDHYFFPMTNLVMVMMLVFLKDHLSSLLDFRLFIQQFLLLLPLIHLQMFKI